MSKFFTGRDGKLVINGTEQVKVTNWSLTGSLEVLETTTLGESQRSYVPGVQEFSGTASLLYYKNTDVTPTRNDAAIALKNVLKQQGVNSSDTVILTFRLVDGTTAKDIVLKAYITSVTYGASVGEIVSAQISFQATGALPSPPSI